MSVIRLYNQSGLCNRLRLFSTYRERAEIEDKDIEMHWVLTPACKSQFNELFHPIPRINFIYKTHGKNPKRSRPANSAISLYSIENEKLNNFYLDIKPLSYIQNEIDNIIDEIGEDFCACHVRRTDIHKVQNKYNQKAIPDGEFFSFIENSKFDKVFLATDNKKTQDTFKKRFGDRVVCPAVIIGNGSPKHPHRMTDVKTAVIDLFLCIYSQEFMGTNCSSFTGFIKRYKEGLNAKQKMVRCSDNRTEENTKTSNNY